MDPDRQDDIASLDTTLTTVERVLDVDGLRSRIEKLEAEASDPNLWDDQARAQKVTSELSHTQGELRRVEELRQRLDDLPVLYEMAAEEGGSSGDDAPLNPNRTSLSRTGSSETSRLRGPRIARGRGGNVGSIVSSLNRNSLSSDTRTSPPPSAGLQRGGRGRPTSVEERRRSLTGLARRTMDSDAEEGVVG